MIKIQIPCSSANIGPGFDVVSSDAFCAWSFLGPRVDYARCIPVIICVQRARLVSYMRIMLTGYGLDWPRAQPLYRDRSHHGTRGRIAHEYTMANFEL